MKTLKTPLYDDVEFAFTTSTYSATGNTYVGITCIENDCFEPYCNLTVNLDMQLGKGLAFIDVNNADKNLLLFLEEQGFITPTGVTRPSGFVVYPLYRLNLEKIGEYKFQGEHSMKNNRSDEPKQSKQQTPHLKDEKFIYLITLDWATEDDKGFEFDICATPEKAFEIFHKRINAEKNPNNSWVGEEVFAEDGSVNKGYTLDTCVDHTFSNSSRWCVSDDDAGRFSDSYLRRVLLQ